MGVSATGQKSLRLTALECFGTGTMEVVLKHMGTAAWASVSPDLNQLHSTGLEDASGDTIRTSSLPCINPAQCGMHVGGRECEGLVVGREHRFDGHLLVVPVKVSIEVVELIR